MILAATGSMRFGQMMFAPQRTTWPPGGFLRAVPRPSVKLPVRSRAEGTRAPLKNRFVFSRRPAYEKKKNVLSFLIGPPSEPPNWLRRYGAFSKVDPHSLALNASFR